ncbi:hypothetical protein [Lederbergia lenta]|uniref:Lipoprotein n=1 Tax=Lederbergia lenta TaxID=1467 RepID=A0A2X4VH67_LEDLE|nr:hypothetical protein [Lederbergia lenta]MCM3112688.1 hypothetical protein [Lederbergia lenta]MEC2323727.1 hypothetical protein [Lederbergia lenta]SQI51556.1 Uncharacterised protein [Lederbergia lenta]
MKKLMVCGIVILVLTGCNSTDSSQGNGATIENDMGVESENSSQTTKEQTDQQQSKVDETTNQQTLTPEEVINETEKQLETNIPIKLPKVMNVSSGQHLTAKTTSDKNQYTVMFLETNEPIPINNDKLEGKEANIATLKATGYGSAEQAAQEINYEDHSKTGAHEVDLGFGITGYSEGAAGSQYIGWNEGRWSLVVRGFTEQGEDVTQEAKNIVAFLEKNTLPAPHDIGAAALDVTYKNDDRKQYITWQEGTIVYEVEMDKSAQDLLEILASIQENK